MFLLQEFTKREIVLVDKHKNEVTVTLWGDYARQFNATGHPVIAIKAAKITDSNFGALSSTASTKLIFDVKDPEHRELTEWYAEAEDPTFSGLV